MDNGQVFGGQYEVRRVLEVGARSTLLEAVSREQEQFAVVEVFRRFSSSAESARFASELERVARLQSRHVVRVLGNGRTSDGANYVVSEPHDGDSLETLLRRHGPLPLVRIVELMLQVCDALEEAHALRIVHESVSPETLLLNRQVDGSSCIKLRGFGQRLALLALGDARQLNAAHFTAPEQLPGIEPIDARTDIWALGATMYELATGHRPFEQPPGELETALLTTEAKPLAERRPGLPVPFSDAVMRCMRRSPSARYDSAAALADAIAPYGPRRGVSGAMRAALGAGATRLKSSTERVVDLVRHRKW